MTTRGSRLPLPSRDEILHRLARRLGFPSPAAASPPIRKGMERAIEQGLECAEPAHKHETTRLLRWSDGVLGAQGIEIRSRMWAALAGKLDEPGTLTCFVLTLGENFDKRIAEDKEASILGSYLMDSFGSELVEWLADELEARLATELLERGYRVTTRFSPGYCDWELAEGQEALFRFLEPKSIGVRRTEAGMMIPRKTVSAAIVGSRSAGPRSACARCPSPRCLHRRETHEPEKHPPRQA